MLSSHSSGVRKSQRNSENPAHAAEVYIRGFLIQFQDRFLYCIRLHLPQNPTSPKQSLIHFLTVVTLHSYLPHILQYLHLLITNLDPAIVSKFLILLKRTVERFEKLFGLCDEVWKDFERILQFVYRNV